MDIPFCCYLCDGYYPGPGYWVEAPAPYNPSKCSFAHYGNLPPGPCVTAPASHPNIACP
jgi:hypothetical protein